MKVFLVWSVRSVTTFWRRVLTIRWSGGLSQSPLPLKCGRKGREEQLAPPHRVGIALDEKFHRWTVAFGILLLSFTNISLAEEKNALFVAFAMTKEQESSPLPTDSGIFLRKSIDSDWQRIGPVIQQMASFATDPNNLNTLFIACGNGIVRSTDGGATWRMTTGWRESDVNKVVVDPENGRNVYASSVWGISASYDGGETWQTANRGLRKRFSRSIMVDSRNPKRLLVGTEDGIYESRDRARSWRPVRSSPKIVVLRMDRSQADPDLWIAGTEGKGVYLSRNDGRRWESAAPDLKEANIYGVTADPHNEQSLAAGGWAVGVWVSSDTGKTWQQTESKLPSPNVMAMTFDANVPGRLWASTFEEGTYYTDDGGKSWQDGDLYGAYVWDLGFVKIAKENG